MNMKDKLKKINFVNFVAIMGTLALAIATFTLFKNIFAKIFSYSLIVISLTLYFFFLIQLLIFIFDKKRFKKLLINPTKSGLLSSPAIAAALLSIALNNIGIPGAPSSVNLTLSFILWIISLIFSLIFVVIVPVNLKFRSEPKHITGVWFLPSVGLFVLISAGDLLALKFEFLKQFMLLFNLFLMGPAFILYFLTLTLVYYRSKFHPLQEGKLAPTFNIILAPVGVSILAVILTTKLFSTLNLLNLATTFSKISELYVILMLGYGLWIITSLIFFYLRVIEDHEKIPFSELWWAFVFPIGAYDLAIINATKFLGFSWLKYLSYTIFVLLLLLWIQVLIKSLLKLRLKNKNIMNNPKEN